MDDSRATLNDGERAELKSYFLERSSDQALYNELERRHIEPQRHYHTLRHLLELFRVLNPLEQQFERPDAVFWAVWFHDGVYDPRESDNEEKSAELARAHLGHLNAELLEAIVSMILATKTHQAQSSDARLFVDADLTILGIEPERYAHYARAIRQEYEFVPQGAYCTGRAAVLERFLEREHIFQTLEFRDRLETQARENLEMEISLLETEDAII